MISLDPTGMRANPLCECGPGCQWFEPLSHSWRCCRHPTWEALYGHARWASDTECAKTGFPEWCPLPFVRVDSGGIRLAATRDRARYTTSIMVTMDDMVMREVFIEDVMVHAVQRAVREAVANEFGDRGLRPPKELYERRER